MNAKLKGSIFILIANICFAMNTSVSRLIIPDAIPPFGFSELRISFACLSFFILGLLIKNNGPKFTLKDHIHLLICGLLGTGINQLSFLGGLSLTSPIDASLIVTCMPIVTMIFASIILKEPISLQKAGGVIVGMSGAILIMYVSSNTQSGEIGGSLKGDLLVFVSIAVYSLYLVLIRPIMQTHSSIHVMQWIFFYGGISILPLCIDDIKFLGELNSNGLPTQTIILELAFTLIIGTFVPYMLVSFGLKLLRPTTVSMYNYTQPIVTSIMAISMGQDRFTWSKPIAALLIFLGVFLVITSKSKEDVERETNRYKTTKLK